MEDSLPHLTQDLVLIVIDGILQFVMMMNI